jgi:RNA polymerase sigma factor (sigma-70 family)
MQGADEADVSGARQGDRDAFARIIERYQRVVYAVSFSSVRDRTLSDDITQDTFVTAWRRLGELRDATRLPAWLCGIARNHARDVRKRRRREQPPVDIAGAQTPFDALSDAETDRLIAIALDGIPDRYREPLVLFYFEQQSAGAVARALGISEATVHQRLSRGRRYLAERMSAVVERGLARRGPKTALVASVLAAIALLPSHVDASPMKGSTMKLTVAAIAVVSIGAVGVMSAVAGPNNPRKRLTDPSPQAASAPKSASKPTSVAKPPASTAATRASSSSATTPALTSTTTVAPDCAAAGKHMAELLAVPKVADALAANYTDKCKREQWSENMRLCIVDADDIRRAQIDCHDGVAATANEVAALPAELRCGVLAKHVYALATGPDGKFTVFKKKDPNHAADIDRMALSLAEGLEQECDERPWSVERRKCVAAAATHAAYGLCPR